MTEALVVQTKRCKACGRDLPFSAFQKDANEKFGLRFYCRECCSRRTRTPEYREYTKKFSTRPSRKYALLKTRHFQRHSEPLIPYEDFVRLIQQPCTYCGGPLPEKAPGLDRIDIAKGYALDNVLPCCDWCNIARSDHLTVEEMKKFVGPAIRLVRFSREAKNVAP